MLVKWNWKILFKGLINSVSISKVSTTHGHSDQQPGDQIDDGFSSKAFGSTLITLTKKVINDNKTMIKSNIKETITVPYRTLTT